MRIVLTAIFSLLLCFPSLCRPSYAQTAIDAINSARAKDRLPPLRDLPPSSFSFLRGEFQGTFVDISQELSKISDVCNTDDITLLGECTKGKPYSCILEQQLRAGICSRFLLSLNLNQNPSGMPGIPQAPMLGSPSMGGVSPSFGGMSCPNFCTSERYRCTSGCDSVPTYGLDNSTSNAECHAGCLQNAQSCLMGCH